MLVEAMDVAMIRSSDGIRAIGKVRMVSGSVVISLPKPLLERASIKIGEAVMIEASADRITLIKLSKAVEAIK
jgi:antitoxin component of MazEF toxin-antitoxin module